MFTEDSRLFRAEDGDHVDAEPGAWVVLKPGAIVRFSDLPDAFEVCDEGRLAKLVTVEDDRPMKRYKLV